MLRYLVLLVTIVICLGWNGPTKAQITDEIQDIFDRGCGDDDGTDRCDDAVQSKMRALYGWESAENLTQAGVTFRRMMFVDGYGNDIVAIEFTRKPGRSPRVQIETPRLADRIRPNELSAAVNQEDWDEIISRSEFFDLKLAREVKAASSDSDVMKLCLHSWFVVAEAGDAPRLQSNTIPSETVLASVRRDAEGACAGGMTVSYAFQTADVALGLLPECQSISRESVRNIPQLLAKCHLLGGDRLAATDALKIIEKIESRNEDVTDFKVRWMVADSARELVPELTKLLNSGQPYLGPPSARDFDHATVKGVFQKKGDGEEDKIADISFELVRQAGDFVVQSFKLSEFRE